MKLTSQTVIGFAVGALIAVGAVLVLRPPPPIVYNSIRIDGNILKSLYNGNFSRMTFNFVNSGTNKIGLQPVIYGSTGAVVPIPIGLVRVSTTGSSISGEKVLDGHLYNLEHFRLNHLTQLQTLISIIDRNPGGYFEFNAADYHVIDPADISHVYYQIVPFTSNGVRISVSNLPVRVVQLNPCPPARQQ